MVLYTGFAAMLLAMGGAVVNLAIRMRRCDSLEGALLGVVGQTLQPAHAALWLRAGRR